MSEHSEIQPIGYDSFSTSLKAENKKTLDLSKIFQKEIENISKYAIGPFFSLFQIILI